MRSVRHVYSTVTQCRRNVRLSSRPRSLHCCCKQPSNNILFHFILCKLIYSMWFASRTSLERNSAVFDQSLYPSLGVLRDWYKAALLLQSCEGRPWLLHTMLLVRDSRKNFTIKKKLVHKEKTII